MKFHKTIMISAVLILVCVIVGIVFWRGKIIKPYGQNSEVAISKNLEKTDIENFDIFSTDFREITNIGEIDGRVYVGGRKKNGIFAVLYNNRQIGVYPYYLSNFTIVDGKSVAIAREDNYEDIKVLVDGFDVQSTEFDNLNAVDISSFEYVTKIKEMSNSNAFIGHKKDSSSIFFNGGENIFGKQILDFVYFDNNFAYINEEKDHQRFVMYGNKKMGPYDVNLNKLKIVDGKLTFTDLHYVMYGDEKFGPFEFVDDSSILEVNNDLVFLAKIDGKNYIVINGEKIDNDFENISCLANVGNKLAYKAYLNGQQYVVYDNMDYSYIHPENEEIKFSDVSCPVEIGGKLAYIARKNLVKDYLMLDGKEIATAYDYIDASSLTDINGEYSFYGKYGGNWFIAYGEDMLNLGSGMPQGKIEKIGDSFAIKLVQNYNPARETGDYYVQFGLKGDTYGPYDYISDIVDFEGQPVFIATKDGINIFFFKGKEEKKLNRRIFFEGAKYNMELSDFIHGSLTKINGKLVFGAKSRINRPKSVLFEGEGRVKNNYSDVSDLYAVTGGYVYVGIDKNSGKKYFNYKNGQTSGPFDEVSQIRVWNGHVAFIGVIGKRENLYLDNVNKGEFDSVDIIFSFETPLSYICKHGGQYFMFVNDKFVEGLKSSDIDNISRHNEEVGLTNNNKLYYTAGGLLMYEGKEYGGDMRFDNISNIVFADNKPAFIGEQYFYSDLPEDGYGSVIEKESKVVFNGKELDNDFVIIDDLIVVNNKLAYSGIMNNKRYVMYDSNQYGPYDLTYDLIEGRGKGDQEPMIEAGNGLAFVAHKENRALVFYKDKVLGEYDKILQLLEIGSKLLYVAETNGFKIVYYDGKEIGYGYLFDSVIDANGKPLFRAEIDNKKYLFYDDEKIGPFDEIAGGWYFNKNEKVYFAGKIGDEWTVYSSK